MHARPIGNASMTTLATAGAVLLVVGVTILQGMWTDRWTGRNVDEALLKAARLLEEFRLRGWIEIRDGARGDGRERVVYLSEKGRGLLRQCLEEEARRLNPPPD